MHPSPSSRRHTALLPPSPELWSQGEGSLSRRSLQGPQLQPPGSSYPTSVETRRLSASSARRPVRSSPLAGPALSPQLRRSSTSTPDLSAPHGPANPRHAARAKSLHNINHHNQAHHEYERAHSSSSQEGSRQKLTKRPQLKVRTSTIAPPYNHAHSASTPNININQPSPLSRINTTDSSASDDKSWMTFSPFAETPRFTRLGLSGQGVVMPLSAKEYQRKRRYTQTSTPNSPASSTGTLPTPAAQADPNWRRSRSFGHADQDILDRHRQALAVDKVEYGASGYHLPTVKPLHPGRIPCSTRSSSTDSTASVSPQYSLPFTPSVSSASSVVTVVDPTTDSFPGKLSGSLVPRKSQSKSSSHSHHSFLAFPKSLRPRDDERSIWSTETAPPHRGHESLDVPPSDQVMGGGPVPERKRRKSLTARLFRAFSRKRNPTN